MLQAICILLLIICLILAYKLAKSAKRVKTLLASGRELEAQIEDLKNSLRVANRGRDFILAKAKEAFHANKHKGYMVAGMKAILKAIEN